MEMAEIASAGVMPSDETVSGTCCAEGCTTGCPLTIDWVEGGFENCWPKFA